MRKINLLDDEDVIIETVEIPTDWSEVTIGVFQDINKFQLLTPEPSEDDSAMEYSIKLLSILTGKEEALIMQLPTSEFNAGLAILDFITNPIENDLVESVDVGGETYFLNKDFDKFTVGETFSIEAIVKRANKFKKNPKDAEEATPIQLVLNELLCVFLRKKNENGKLEKFKAEMMDRAELFKSVKVTDVHKLFLFFSLGNQL